MKTDMHEGNDERGGMNVQMVVEDGKAGFMKEGAAQGMTPLLSSSTVLSRSLLLRLLILRCRFTE
jgi:hypothetical protein